MSLKLQFVSNQQSAFDCLSFYWHLALGAQFYGVMLFQGLCLNLTALFELCVQVLHQYCPYRSSGPGSYALSASDLSRWTLQAGYVLTVAKRLTFIEIWRAGSKSCQCKVDSKSYALKWANGSGDIHSAPPPVKWGLVRSGLYLSGISTASATTCALNQGCCLQAFQTIYLSLRCHSA